VVGVFLFGTWCTMLTSNTSTSFTPSVPRLNAAVTAGKKSALFYLQTSLLPNLVDSVHSNTFSDPFIIFYRRNNEKNKVERKITTA